MDYPKLELENRAKILQNMLQCEGYGAKAPEWDEQDSTWDVRVHFEGMAILVIFDLDDPLFVRVVLPNFWHVEPYHLSSALAALDMANKKAKGAKVYLNLECSGSIASMEFLYNGSGQDGPMLVRTMRMVTNVAKIYVDAIKASRALTATPAHDPCIVIQ
jgi:hypothetical protein